MKIAAFHKQRTGRNPQDPPQRFTDKIYYRKLNDRRSLLTRLTDKVQTKQIAEEHSLPTLHIGSDYQPSKYPFIAKPNNYSGQTALIKNSLEWEQFVDRWETLKQKTYGAKKGEWAYKNIEPKLIIEPVIEEFWDLKCYVFDGRVEVFYVCGKMQGWQRPESAGVSYFWPDGEFINVTHNGKPRPYKEVPFNVTGALDVAEEITPDIDFVRTDLMIADKIYISEFTLYPGSGCIDFEPDYFDYQLGKFWNLNIN